MKNSLVRIRLFKDNVRMTSEDIALFIAQSKVLHENLKRVLGETHVAKKHKTLSDSVKLYK